MLLLMFIIFLLMLGSAPHWGHSRNWGYGPSGTLGTLLIVLLILLMLGVIPNSGLGLWPTPPASSTTLP